MNKNCTNCKTNVAGLQESGAIDTIKFMESENFLKKEYKSLLLILVLFLINLVLFNHKMINVHTDFGREVFFAKLVSQNAVLYKDMFNTFLCPFSYLFNGLILKFLPVHLNTFYFAGAINALVILYGSYFVARKFLSRTISTVLTVFIMYYCCFYAGLMNFLMPYSYAVVYGLSACIISIFLFLNYLNENKKSYLYASFFFAGAGASTKYEYILYAVMLAVFFAFLKKESLKTYVRALSCIFIIPLICLAALMLQGLGYGDLKNFCDIFSSFVHQPYLKKVYEATFYFNTIGLVHIVRCLAISGIIFFFFRKAAAATMIIAMLCVLFSLSAINYFAYDFWCFLPVVTLLMAVIKHKQIIKDTDILFITISAIVISCKSFWMLSTNFYGRYFLPLLIIAFIVVAQKYYVEDQKLFEKSMCFLLIFLCFAAIRLNIALLLMKNTPIITNRGTIYEQKQTAQEINSLIEFIQQHTKEQDRIVVLGNAPLLNFLTQRNSINFYNHFDEAIYTAYGENRISQAYKTDKPEFFIITESFCGGYGKFVCDEIKKSYRIKRSDSVLIFEKI